ncbi:MAG: glutamine--fructose-6-phosphate transaminase (isomerizing), partial [Solirubrobacteraceae bacterium]
MCGIVAYLGNRDAYSIIIKGLKRLEYRGYDSAGIVLFDNKKTLLLKTKGKVEDLKSKYEGISFNSGIGMGHTRWATHGVPNDVNSHPHASNSEELFIVHNGIIENYNELKIMLTSNGFTFKSDTDSEVLINFIEFIKNKHQLTLSDSIRYALNEVVGAYSIVVIDKNNPQKIIVAKSGSPMALGIGKNEFFVASDVSPFLEYTKDAIYLEDGEMAEISLEKGIDVRKIKDNNKVDLVIQQITFDLEQIAKGGYDHFMLKEIHEQPKSIKDTLRGRLLVNKQIIRMAGIFEHEEKFLSAKRIIIIACGTSWHSGLVGEYLIEEFARIPVEVEYASEFRYRNPIINKGDVVIAISQSGETADTLAALKMAKEQGAFIYGICNVVGSSIARITDAGSYTHAGPEIGVASTKAFTTQITLLTLIALELGRGNGNLSKSDFNKFCIELEMIPSLVQKVIDSCIEKVIEIAKEFKDSKNFLYLGRGYNFPIALEGALKLKEISYIHAEGYPAAEMKHGPIALIDENMPVVVIVNKQRHHEKIVSNIQEIKARKGKVIAIINEGDEAVKAMADYVIELPNTSEQLSPILNTIPLQFLAYFIATYIG